MSKRAAKWALAVGMSLGLWKGAQALPPPPLTEVFNTESLPVNPVREYRVEGLQPPDGAKGEIWRVRLGSWEMAKSGHHTFLEFGPYCEKSEACPSQGDIYQIHGIAMDGVRKSHASLDFSKIQTYARYAEDDYVLKVQGVNHDHNKAFFNKKPDVYVDVFYGTKDEVLKYYMDAMQLAGRMNVKADSYELLDQNSNSVQRTLLEGLGLKVPDIYVPHMLSAVGGRIWCPGVELSLLPQDWNRLQARAAGGYGQLSGDDLERAARKISLGTDGVWPQKPATPPKAPGA